VTHQLTSSSATLAFVDLFRGLAATVTHTDINADALHAALCDISVKTLHLDQGSNYMSEEFEVRSLPAE